MSLGIKTKMKKILPEAISNLSVGVVIFALLHIILPSVDVNTDLLMVNKLFTGAYGCINPKWWSDDFNTWQACLEDPELYCSQNLLLNSTCTRVSQGILGFTCNRPEL